METALKNTADNKARIEALECENLMEVALLMIEKTLSCPGDRAKCCRCSILSTMKLFKVFSQRVVYAHRLPQG